MFHWAWFRSDYVTELLSFIKSLAKWLRPIFWFGLVWISWFGSFFFSPLIKVEHVVELKKTVR